MSGLGRQGGDLRQFSDSDWLDLSTCVNPYQSSPAVTDALRCLSAEHIRVHPYSAHERLAEVYGQRLDVRATMLVVGRGTTEFIWTLARIFKGQHVAVPKPAYTDFLRAFPQASDTGFGIPVGVDDVDLAMGSADAVVISNPSNPTGALLEPDALIEVCRARPKSLLIVDESYSEFWPDPAAATLIGAGVDNLVVLRSPSKFYGIAGVRTGAAWTKNANLRAALAADRGAWPVSEIDARIAIAALSDDAWARDIRRQLVADGKWLETVLVARGTGPVDETRLHYRLWRDHDAVKTEVVLRSHGVLVRRLEAAHGFPNAVLRVTAPREDARERLAIALDALP